ncbi:MAG: class I SAM-dependent methyltransferase [Gammaproteobacteria bacterium]|nr:class I SAM-dependent methyltransferase [Gammaproteobacteria bacterium]
MSNQERGARLSSSFGEQTVTQTEREQLIRSVFKRVAPRYDLMNDMMSMGIHRLWKWRFCREILQQQQAPQKNENRLTIDLAGGTADIALGLQRDHGDVMVVDPSHEMMQVGQQRADGSIQFIGGSGEAIPLADNSVDVLTISFGIRNSTDLSATLDEIYRVLKPGGRFYCLEFSTPKFWLRAAYNLWSRLVIPRLGAMVSGNPDAYTYLIESIRKFPDQHEMVKHIEQSGMERCSFTNLSFGIACIHRANKPT